MKDALSIDEDFVLWALLHQTTDAMIKLRQLQLDRYHISSRQVYFPRNRRFLQIYGGMASFFLIRRDNAYSALFNQAHPDS